MKKTIFGMALAAFSMGAFAGQYGVTVAQVSDGDFIEPTNIGVAVDTSGDWRWTLEYGADTGADVIGVDLTPKFGVSDSLDLWVGPEIALDFGQLDTVASDDTWLTYGAGPAVGIDVPVSGASYFSVSLSAVFYGTTLKNSDGGNYLNARVGYFF